MTTKIASTVHELVVRSRAAQGLAPMITDDATLEKIAVLLHDEEVRDETA